MIVNKDHWSALRSWKQRERERERKRKRNCQRTSHSPRCTMLYGLGIIGVRVEPPTPYPIFCRLYADVKMTSLMQLAAANTCVHVPVKARMTLVFYHHLSPFPYLYDLTSHYVFGVSGELSGIASTTLLYHWNGSIDIFSLFKQERKHVNLYPAKIIP
jgi:hypothetical protein